MDENGQITSFFDDLYATNGRYWWKGDNRYDGNPDSHPRSLITQMMLRTIQRRPPGYAIDLGCGEGVDAIRLALLGWQVDAIDLSGVAVEKTQRFAEQAGVSVHVKQADISSYEFTRAYDLMICNGVLHYVPDPLKAPLLRRASHSTNVGGLHVVSLWSTATPVPAAHQIVPCYPDLEDGVVAQHYAQWHKHLLYCERGKEETSHDGFPIHNHSYIKLIAERVSAERSLL